MDNLRTDLIFKDVDEGWATKNLNEFCLSISSGKDKVSENGHFILYGSTGAIGKTENSSYRGKYILVARVGANAGLLNKVEGKFGVTDNTLVIDLKRTDLFDYIFYYLERIGLNKLVFGSGQPLITGNQLKNLIIHYPLSIIHSNKIASCLSSLDEVIAAHIEKLELLKAHKKGLMQNLFPQEGEKVPRYRFKEFEKDGEWVFEPFNQIYSFLVTNSFSRDFLNYDNGSVKNIHYGDIHTKFSTLFDITKESVPFINPDVSIDRIRKECYCIEGDIIFADASEDLNDVGKSIEIVKLNEEKLVSGLHTLMARQVVRKIEIGFGGYLFKSDRIRKQIQKESQGTKVLSISGTRISNIEIFFPKNPKEQQKIASCLSSLDGLITAQAEKIELLKLHKKGLMQGLFPKIDE